MTKEKGFRKLQHPEELTCEFLARGISKVIRRGRLARESYCRGLRLSVSRCYFVIDLHDSIGLSAGDLIDCRRTLCVVSRGISYWSYAT